MRPVTALPPLIMEKLDDVRALCEKYRVKRLTVFGSAAKGTFDPEKSDLDFLVEFRPDAPIGGLRGPYFSFLRELCDLFDRRVDIVDPGAIDNPYIVQSIRRSQVDAYEAA